MQRPQHERVSTLQARGPWAPNGAFVPALPALSGTQGGPAPKASRGPRTPGWIAALGEHPGCHGQELSRERIAPRSLNVCLATPHHKWTEFVQSYCEVIS